MKKAGKPIAFGMLIAAMAISGAKTSTVKASNNINLYYTYGAPSSDNQLISYGVYKSLGKDYVILHVPTFHVTYTGPYVAITTTPRLNMTSFNSAITGYRNVQYVNGASVRVGKYIGATSQLYNYNGQRSVAIYGEIREGNG
ncbi:hypothetical protein [[Clostridium] polysaccharolyticum]|uniref:Uncharacterized protein n=1 Tax=[Clostridium] polysaccharolyticum TaxID=29364 RepID=A0A1H9YTE7_9FIRM|nr:hypothetical protein [[Clostridium] polysaccharolyticum]SES71950.1 hypothetical protein SAMN04487772_102179 [[Clostridium] polysaccharolyticum]